jgi:DNA ligase-1
MRRWAETAELVAATRRTSEKVAILADYLRQLPETDLPIAAVFLTGRPFAQAEPGALGLGWATIASVVTALAGRSPADLARAYDRSSDLGTAVADLLNEAGWQPLGPPLTLLDVADAFAAIRDASGPAAKATLLADLLRRADPRAARAIVKIVTGELRIGLREGLLEAALARAFQRPLAAVQWAVMLTGDLGEAALLAQQDRLAEARPQLLRPLTFMLASPADDPAEILRRLGPTVWVEDKYDGIRAQLHKAGSTVRLFSRDLRDVSHQFPELIRAAASLPWDGIVDGEILAVRDATILPFLQLQARLGRKDPDETIQRAVPVALVAFDLLALASPGEPVEPLLRLPLRERRRRLEGLTLPAGRDAERIRLSHLTIVDSVAGLEAAFAAARERGNEGLMVKDPESLYTPGRRGMGWLKLKRALATIDAVVVAVEEGHGKRHGLLSDYTFAIRDEATGELVTIGKAYSGLSDAEIAEMTRFFTAHTLRRHGRYRVVEPLVVVEVAFDVIMRSRRHRSGFALRFPRIVRLRPDKTAAEVDTVGSVEALYRRLQPAANELVTLEARRAG